MNDDVATGTALTVQNEDLMQVLQTSLYPGASKESIALVLSYCRVNGLDPLLKPVHIVRMKVKTGYDKQNKRDIEEYRDVLMPGIADYRIKAARSGQYGGKSEPEFGPTINNKELGVTYPEWCKVTVKRIIAGEARDFPAKEYWLENYSNDRHSNKPNYMWKKRPFGQLAKVAESQALRMAFPEFSGSQPTAEEMEGKEFEGQTIEHEPDRPASLHASQPRRQPESRESHVPDSPPSEMQRAAREAVTAKRQQVITRLRTALDNAQNASEVTELGNRAQRYVDDPSWPQADRTAIRELIVDAMERFSKFPQPTEEEYADRLNLDEGPLHDEGGPPDEDDGR